MLTKIFSVKDNKLSTYGLPFYEKSEIQAIRSLHIALKDKNLQLSNFPEDFDLFELGIFDDSTGKIEIYNDAKFIISAVGASQLKGLENRPKE